ncbi:hypothetical protein E1293_08655 [Actinomadura darangshiensis]|uniref:Bifunctional 5,10-methylenetetrahydrofolate dehydrogenase/5,10-methenyltetrahydrofolate cyclohydrolase n=1 Tax=Actinomadura darangshiensis TaxID=705336 RepID=A0A4R5BJS1_9ACTN|nr:tetrahydrofolate dehydrogenase/cyclohydrolase catalytic domain-containing protein [Actinomadura darangshiensis]TDD87008.1 hypothetical protein E1293_08655 [Actinomadura darangshiensis]
MGVDKTGSGNDGKPEDVEKPSAKEGTWKHRRDQPGEPGQPSRVASWGGVMSSVDTGEKRDERDDEHAPPEDEKPIATPLADSAESEKEVLDLDTSSSAAEADDNQDDDGQPPEEAQGEGVKRQFGEVTQADPEGDCRSSGAPVSEWDEQSGNVDQTGADETAPEGSRRTPEIPIQMDGNQIRGAKILGGVKELFEPYRSTIAGLERQVAVIRFEASPEASPDWQSRMEASRVSAEQKVKSFNYLGYEPNHILLPSDASAEQFADVLAQLGEDQSTSGIIVQFPPPPRLREVVQDLAPAKDVDALVNTSPQEACATAEGIWRVVEPFTDETHNVAVVGSRGFVGRGVVHFLQQNGIDPLELEEGDDLTRVREAEIIVSATGRPGILGSDHVRPHHLLVVDSGFVPRQGGVSGDVRSEVYGVPQHITPVPGGIGPVEMAVLMERMAKIDVDPENPGWRLTRRSDDLRKNG